MLLRRFPVLLILLVFLLPLRAQAEPNQRIVSVDSNATEVLMALGLSERIVAADITSQSLLSAEVPDLGYHRALSAEGILDSNPDWVIGSNHMGPEETLNLLKKAPLKLVQLDSPHTLDELQANIAELGRLLQREQQAASLMADIEQRRMQLPSNVAQKQQMVFLLDLGDRGLSQAGKGTTADALITLLGGENVSQFGGYKSLTVEALLAINPDVILLGQRADGELDVDVIQKRHPLLSKTRAGKNGHIVGVNAAKLIAGISLGALDEALAIADKLTP